MTLLCLYNLAYDNALWKIPPSPEEMTTSPLIMFESYGKIPFLHNLEAGVNAALYYAVVSGTLNNCADGAAIIGNQQNFGVAASGFYYIPNNPHQP